LSAIPTDKPFNIGTFFVGVDLGQKWDHSAIAVLRKDGDIVSLVHMKRFKLGTEYGVVLGYLKLLQRTLQTVQRVYIDRTGVGEFFVEQVIKEGIKNVKGIMLSLPEKENIMVCMKRTMEKDQLRIPYDSELINEINVERYEQTQTNQTKFSHPNGTHDDRLWALALAVYASGPAIPRYVPFVAFGHVSKPKWDYRPKEYPLSGNAPPNVTVHRCLGCWKPYAECRCPPGVRNERSTPS
jgi:phage FluMu gp28-like protein